MFWFALMLVFAQVAHAFDVCAAHLENTRPLATSVSAPCVAKHPCELCALAPAEDICEVVSEWAVLAPLSDSPLAPPVILVDAPFIASPISSLEASTVALGDAHSSDVPPLRSQFLAPQLCGRAPPFWV